MRRKSNTIVCTYKSVGEMSSRLKSAKVQKPFEYDQCSQEVGASRTRFTGSESYDAADDLLLYGDKDLASKIENAGVAKMRSTLVGKDMKREIYSSVAGFAPHVPNYIAGMPMSMLAVRQKRLAAPVVDLYYNMTASGDTPAEYIINASAKVISAAMKVEASGVRLNIHTAVTAEKKGQHIVFTCKIKTSGQPFDVMKMAYPMAHPSMLRRHYFRCVETTEDVKQCYVNSYGHVVSGDNAREILKESGVINENARVIDYYQARKNSIDEIVKMIVG